MHKGDKKMNLIELKQNYKVKQNSYIIRMYLISLFLMIGAIIYHQITKTQTSNIIMIIMIMEFLFVATFWFIWFVIQIEKNKQLQMEMVYGKLTSNYNDEHNTYYKVLKPIDIPKHIFKGLSIYKYTQTKIHLCIEDQTTSHKLFLVSFIQSTGKSQFVKSSGLLYQMISKNQFDQLESDYQFKDKYQIKTTTLDQKYYIYSPDQQPPYFKKFNESELYHIKSFFKNAMAFLESIQELI